MLAIIALAQDGVEEAADLCLLLGIDRTDGIEHVEGEEELVVYSWELEDEGEERRRGGGHGGRRLWRER